ncbi:MAG TPA: hypothetical protein VM736_03985 [Gemmatimonadales bacterium]|nr:hypothetical protein [Gemmatimonadales bacterium]
MTAPASAAARVTRQQPFILSGYRGAPTEGAVTIQVFDRAARWRRALAGLGKWVGVALLAVFVPVAHFVLVPSFALYGVWEFAQRLGTAELAAAGRGTCPDCGREQPLDLAQRWYAPQPVSCRYCHRGLRLSIPT